MKPRLNCRRPVVFALFLALTWHAAGPAGANPPGEAGSLRRFHMKDGRSFEAAITSKTDTSVTLRQSNGLVETASIGLLSESDQKFVTVWTEFKALLLRDAEFSAAGVQDLLELRGYRTFEFEIRGNHIFVDGELNGKPQKFLIDTGADTTLLDSKAAKDCGLELVATTDGVSGVSGKASASVAKVPMLKLGDVLITNRRIMTADLFEDQSGPRNFGVLFGADFLRELNAVISYREGRMFLRMDPAKVAVVPGTPVPGTRAPAPTKLMQGFRQWNTVDGRTLFAVLDGKSGSEVVLRMQNGGRESLPADKFSQGDQAVIAQWSPLREKLAADPRFKQLSVKELLELRGYQSLEYRLNQNHIILDGEADGKKTRFLIDTGAQGGVFNIDFAKQSGLEVGPLDRSINGIGGKSPAALVKVRSLRLGDTVVENREMLAADMPGNRSVFGSSHDALLGADFLGELDAVISYKDGRMFLLPGEGG